MTSSFPIPVTYPWRDVLAHMAGTHGLSTQAYVGRLIEHALMGDIDDYAAQVATYKPKTSHVVRVSATLDDVRRRELNLAAIRTGTTVTALARTIVVIRAHRELATLPPSARGDLAAIMATARYQVPLPAFALNEANRRRRVPHWYWANAVQSELVAAWRSIEVVATDNGAEVIMRGDRRRALRTLYRDAYARSIRQTQALIEPDTFISVDAHGVDVEWLAAQVGPARGDAVAALLRAVALIVLERNTKP